MTAVGAVGARVRWLVSRLRHPAVSLAAFALAIATLFPEVIPGLSTAQLALSGTLLAIAVTAAIACSVSPSGRRRRWWLRLLVGFAVVALLLVAWTAALFFAPSDDWFLGGRELVAVVDGGSARYYLYQHADVPDGPGGPEIMERQWLLRRSVWRHPWPAEVVGLFDGRSMRLGSHELRLARNGPTLHAWIDGAPARVVSVGTWFQDLR